MDFDESSSSVSSDDVEGLMFAHQAPRGRGGGENAPSRFQDPALEVAAAAAPPRGASVEGDEHHSADEIHDEYENDDDDHEHMQPHHVDGDGIVHSNSTSEEDVRPVEIPSWAQNLERPMTSSKVGRFSKRDDEFFRHKAHSASSTDEDVQEVDDDDDESTRDQISSPLYNLKSAVTREEDSTITTRERNNDDAAGDEEEPEVFPVTDSAEWQLYLESGVLIDETPFTQMYRIEEPAPHGDEEDADAEADGETPSTVVTLFKVFNPPFPEDAIATDFDRVGRLSKRLCRSIFRNAELIAGDKALCGGVIAGVQEVHCDSQTRMIVQLQPILPSVNLLDIVAFTIITSEHVRMLITKLIHQLSRIHEAGLVHGSLHGGNVLVHATTGAVVVSDGCGLLSCPVLAPDLSFVSPHLAAHLKDLIPADSDVAQEPNSFLNELWTAFYEDPYQESSHDDTYAVAQLIALLINGFPSRFGMNMLEALSDIDIHPAPQLLTTASGGEYFRNRAASAGFTEEYLHQAQELIDTLVSCDSVQSPEILEHPFLISGCGVSEDVDSQLAEFIMQIANEGLQTIEFSRKTCGSAPMSTRLYRNSLLAHNVAAARGSHCQVETVSTSWECQTGITLVGEDTVLVEGSNLRIVLHRAFPPARTKLIIRNVSDSSIVLLGHMMHVVLDHVEDSSVALGPCQSCLLHHVHRCPRIAIAACQPMLHHISDVELALHAGELPLCPEPASLIGLRIVPYCISYPGLSEDFEYIGLSQESQASLLDYQDSDTVLMKRAPIELFLNYRTGHDYPYLRSMATIGQRIIHQHTVNDLYLFQGEARDHRVVIEDVKGGLCSTLLNGTTATTFVAPDSPTRLSKSLFPVIMILDVVEDVFISDCEYVTIVVFGAKSSVNINNVKNAKIFVCGTYVMMSDCSHCEVYGFALRGAMIEDCQWLEVMPLVADLPAVDAIFAELVTASGLNDTMPEDNIFLSPRVQQHRNREVHIQQRPQCFFHLSVPGLASEPSKLFSPTMVAANGSPISLLEMDLKSALYENHKVKVAPVLDGGDDTNKSESEGDGPSSPPPSVIKRSTEVTVVFSRLIDASILRVAGTLCPARSFTASEPTCNVLVSELETGIMHIADAVGALTIANCSGPLDIIVAAAQQVTIVNCENITVQVACFSFTATSCRNCHFALHVNTEPMLEQHCRNIVVSALNVTCSNYEEILERCAVQQHVNLFDRVVDAERPKDEATDPYEVTKKAVKGLSIGEPSRLSVESLTSTMDSVVSANPSTVAEARAVLSQMCNIVPPLQGTCVGAADAPFLEALEDRVAREEKRTTIQLVVLRALRTLASSSVDDLSGSSPTIHSTPNRFSPNHSSSSPMKNANNSASMDRGVRPSGALGHRHRMDGHYDSSSDEEQESTHSNSEHDETSPQRARDTDTVGAAVEVDTNSPSNKSNAPVSTAPPPPVVPPLSFGAMASARDESSSEDDDSSSSSSRTSSSDEDEVYAHRTSSRAAVVVATNGSSPVPVPPATCELSIVSVEDSPAPAEDAPRRSASPATDSHSPTTSKSRERGKDSNVLRCEVPDFKAFLDSQQSSHTGPSAPQIQEEDVFEGVHIDVDGESSAVSNLSEAMDSNATSSPPRAQNVTGSSSADNSPKPPPKALKASALGFDDTSSSEDEDPTKEGQAASLLSRQAAAAAMGISAENIRRGTGRSRIASAIAVTAIPADATDDGIDVSEDPLARLRSINATKATSSPEKAANSASTPPKASVTPLSSSDTALSSAFNQQSPFDEKRASTILAPVVSDRVVIFLDIDGVLLPVSPMCFGGGDLDDSCIRRFKSIVDACGGTTKVTIVLTSTWRNDAAKKVRLNAAFNSCGGIPNVYLGIPDGVPQRTAVTYLASDPQEQKLVCDRVDEIQLFLEENAAMLPEAAHGGRWLVIDDMDLGVDDRLAGHFVKTDTEEGLTDGDVERAKSIIEGFASFTPAAEGSLTSLEFQNVLHPLGERSTPERVDMGSWSSYTDRKTDKNEASLRGGGESFLLPVTVTQDTDACLESPDAARQRQGTHSFDGNDDDVEDERITNDDSPKASISTSNQHVPVEPLQLQPLDRSDPVVAWVEADKMSAEEKQDVLATVQQIQALRRKSEALSHQLGDFRSRLALALQRKKTSATKTAGERRGTEENGNTHS